MPPAPAVPPTGHGASPHWSSLSAADELPVHQTPDLVRHAATSDRNFYDRYYFNCHPLDGSRFLIFGMGQYPNLGVQDFFAVVRQGSRHLVVRGSRPLTDRLDLAVGPFRVEVLEPLRRLRVVLEPTEHPIAFDLEWTARVPAFEEDRHQWRSHGRVMIDTTRFAQVGRWSGRLTVAGEGVAVDPAGWWGTRDRSWGVRPVGEPEPAGIHGLGLVEQGFLWNYAPMQFDDHAILYICQERNGGARDLESAVRVWADPERPPERLGRPEHHHALRPGTRLVEQATLSFPEAPGGAIEVAVEPLLELFLGVGSGYGMEADWRHGMYQGPGVAVQGLDLDMDAEPERFWGLVDSVARFRYDDLEGYGLHEYGFFGPFDRYGLTGFLEGAPPAERGAGER